MYTGVVVFCGCFKFKMATGSCLSLFVQLLSFSFVSFDCRNSDGIRSNGVESQSLGVVGSVILWIGNL